MRSKNLFKKIMGVTLAVAFVCGSTIYSNASEGKVKTYQDDSNFLVVSIPADNTLGNFINIDVDSYNGKSLIDLNKIYYSGKKVFTDTKYSYTTLDGKIKWNPKQDVVYTQVYKSKSFNNFITLDNKAVSFPIKLSNFGSEYAAFENFDLKSYLTVDELLHVKNKKNNYNLYLYNDLEEKYSIGRITNENNEYLIDFIIYNGKINELANIYEIGKADIRAGGIGIGNTLNEMYAKLGTPTKIEYKKSGNYVAVYDYVDWNNRFQFSVEFKYTGYPNLNIFGDNSVNYYPNTITGVMFMGPVF